MSSGGLGTLQELSLVKGAPRRDFGSVLWQIAEKRVCDEIAIHYDCGHAFLADVWVPSLPNIREYGALDAERQLFARHGFHILVRQPGSAKCQITIPEGRCRHCGRGNRQALTCGVLHLDIADGGGKGGAAASRRLELPLSGHAFLASVGRVCRLPEDLGPPPILQGVGQCVRPFDGPSLTREATRPWTRKEVEDELRGALTKVVGLTTFAMFAFLVQCLYLCATHVNAVPQGAAGENVSSISAVLEELSNASSLFAFEVTVASSSWALSSMTIAVHRTFGALPGESVLWAYVWHPLWALLSTVLVPMFWVIDVVAAVPKVLALNGLLSVIKVVLLKPCAWSMILATEIANNSDAFSPSALWRNLVIRPCNILSQLPLANPMAAAVVSSLLVAALSAPQTPSFSLPSLWDDLPNFEISRSLESAASCSKSLGPFAQRLSTLWRMRTRHGRQKGYKGASAKGGAKENNNVKGRGARGEAGGKSDKLTGKVDGKASGNSSAPACFVCLDRPSQYILEPCGHRVVCEECAVQFVEAAARNRGQNDTFSGPYHGSERGGGGACPSCGTAITRAMRLFS